jgi:predicted MPP superfamily phosphohydrolase
VAFVADIHIQHDVRLGYIEKFAAKVNEQNPDIVLFGGDILEGDGENEASAEMEQAIRGIKSKYGSFGVLGNHEFYGWKQNTSFFDKAGITLLNDSVTIIDSSFYLAGRYDQHFRDRISITEMLEKMPSEMPIILLDHRPMNLTEIGNTKVDVQFSGHTHNGQLFPFNFIIKKIYELGWGYKKIGNTQFFVTSGLRLWGPPVKTTGKSEIMIVDFSFK